MARPRLTAKVVRGMRFAGAVIALDIEKEEHTRKTQGRAFARLTTEQLNELKTFNEWLCSFTAWKEAQHAEDILGEPRPESGGDNAAEGGGPEHRPG